MASNQILLPEELAGDSELDIHGFQKGELKEPSPSDILIPNQDPETLALVDACRRSLAITAVSLFPDAFDLPFSEKIHDWLFYYLEKDISFQDIDRDVSQQVAIAANRGAGKTTIMQVYLAHQILFQQKKFIIAISSSFQKIVEDTETLKRELMTNEMILKLFGGIEAKENIAKDRWIARNTKTGIDTMVLPRGAEQQTRGWKYGFNRPDLIYVDDLEDPNSRDSEEVRAKKERWFFTDVCNAIHRPSKKWRIIVVGTVLHQLALVNKLLGDPDWDGRRLELCDAKGHSNWPEFCSDDEIAKVKAQLERQGLLDEFYLEYRNLPMSTEDQVFQRGYFQYYKDHEINLNRRADVVNAVLVDPARVAKPNSADTAIIGVGIDLSNGRIYYRFIDNGKYHVDEQWERILAMCERCNTYTVVYETTGLGEHGTFPLINYASERGVRLDIIEAKNRNRKDAKQLDIKDMSGFYRRGLVFHNEGECEVLEDQLLTFPKPTSWDVMDAASRVVELMSKGGLYAPFISTDPAADVFDDGGDDESFFKECEKEDKEMEELGVWGVQLT